MCYNVPMEKNPLEKEFEYYVNHQNDLVNSYRGKFIVIKDQQVIGSYDTEIEAYQNTQKEYELGTFLIQHVEPGEDSYTQTFYSQVVV